MVEVGEEQGVRRACEVALEATHDLLGAFALRGAPLGVGAGGGVDAQAGERDHPQRVVGFAVVAAVEPVADGLAGGGLDRADAAQGGKRGAAETARLSANARIAARRLRRLREGAAPAGGAALAGGAA